MEHQFICQDRISSFFIWMLNSGEWDILILITRKGYWLYKVTVSQEIQLEVKKKGKKIYSDRYISKCLDMQQFAGKRVWIYDDTMTNGVTMFFYYSFLRKKGAEVTPFVFGLSTEYPSDNSKRLLIREYGRVCRNEGLTEKEQRERAEMEIECFNRALRWEVRMASKQIASLCTQETQYFQDKLCPMVVDLPVLSRMENPEGISVLPAYMNQGSGEGIQIPLSLFERLKQSGTEWKYVENTVDTEGIRVNCSYFKYRNPALEELSGIVYDGIVKCKAAVEEDQVRLVFAPFAIFKSMTFHDVAECFFRMLDNTEYGRKVFHHIFGEEKKGDSLELDSLRDDQAVIRKMKKDHNLCRNMFRGIIFYVSHAVGAAFAQYFYDVTGVRLDYDWELMEESFSQEFIRTFCGAYRNKSFSWAHLSNLSFTAVDPLGWKGGHRGQKVPAERKDAELHILNELIEKKRRKEDGLRGRIYTIETIEAELDENFLFKSQEQKKEIMTGTILALLDTSRFGNEIYVDNEREIVYRGFRYGENSELLFLKGMSYVATFMEAFYDSLTQRQPDEEKARELYVQYYPVFSRKMEQYFRKEQFFDYLIDMGVFDFLKKYYGEIPADKMNEMITGKQMVWDRVEKMPALDFFKERAYSAVSQWE